MRPARIKSGVTDAAASLHPVQPDLAVEAAILLPFRVDLDVEEEMNLAAEQLRQLGPRRLADRADARAALAEHDRLLAVAADEDLLVDGDRAVLALLIFLGLDRALIRELGVELEVELLAGDFGGEHPIAGVGDLVLGKMP